MTGFILGAIIGAVVGWNTSQPEFVERIVKRIKGDK
jgi:hypothetical protein